MSVGGGSSDRHASDARPEREPTPVHAGAAGCGRPAPSRCGERLVALFLFGLVAFSPPLLRAVGASGNDAALYVYVFCAWTVLIALVAWTVEREARRLGEHDAG